MPISFVRSEMDMIIVFVMYGRDQKRDRTEAAEHQLDLAGLLVELVAHALHRIRAVA